MKRTVFAALLCSITLSLHAQRLTRTYQREPLSRVLEDLNAATTAHTIYFVYDELEDFTVTTRFQNLLIEEAVGQVVGFYPMKVTYDDSRIFVECTQKETAKVIGRVVDSSGNPVEYANVSLYSVAATTASGLDSTRNDADGDAAMDGAFINGSVSNENGDFVIPCQAPRATVSVSCIGYTTVRQRVSVGEIGTITLHPQTYTLDGVTVEGEMPQYTMTAGGVQVDVQHSLLHDIGTADDLLAMMPMVQRRDGKLEVLAKGEPEIYINNKKVRQGATELKQLKSADIKSVEIITAPGAQYSAEVNAVIRIRTLRPQGDGISLLATTQTWRNNRWNNYDDLTMKYRSGGLEAFLSAAFDWNHNSLDQDIDQELQISQDLFQVHATLPIRVRWAEFQYKVGLSYDLGANHSAGLSFSTKKSLYTHYKSSMTQNYQKNGAHHGDILLETLIDEPDKPQWELNTYYIGKAGELGIDLNATLLRRQAENDINQQERSQQLGNRPITTVNKEKNTMAAAKLILTHPLWKGQLSVGTEATSTQSHGNNLNQENIIPQADIEMHERNIAGFAEYGLQQGHWRFSGGLRYEHVATAYHAFGEYQEAPSRTYNDWFPSLAAVWQKGKWSAQLSYGKRITRPPYAMLSSMIVYDSRMFYEGGNPLLRPSTRQSIDLILTRAWLTFTAGVTRERDLFSHIAQVYDEQNEIAIFRPANFHHQDRVYATLVASPKLGCWQPTLTLHYYQQAFDAEAYGVPRTLNKPEFSLSLDSWFVAGPTTKALLQASHTGSSHWAFMRRGSNFVMNARLQKTLRGGQLVAALYANDILRTCRTRLTTYYAVGYTAQHIYNHTQQVGLALSYHFNASSSKYKGTGAGNDEKTRLYGR